MKKIFVLMIALMIAGFASGISVAQTPWGQWGGDNLDGSWNTNDPGYTAYEDFMTETGGEAICGPFLLTSREGGWKFLAEDATTETEGYEPVYLDLWVEAFATMTYQSLQYDFHCIPDGTDDCFWFFIDMQSHGNVTALLGFQPGVGYGGNGTVNKIEYVGAAGLHAGSIAGATTTPIYIEWWYTSGPGPGYLTRPTPADPPNWTPPAGWTQLTNYNSGDVDALNVSVEPCDQAYTFFGRFCVPYHAHAGHWRLVILGCPIPEAV
ncbi:hypothetical protein KQI52_06840 [bacterium]|nr:hypothetical protein [bacterium]